VGNGLDAGVNQGPLIDEQAIEKVERHISDAVAKGASIKTGGKKHTLGGLFFEPTVLANVTNDMQIMTEETFGPTIAINRVKNMAEAIELTNASRYGLGASVWSKRRGKQIASQLHTGMVSINSVIAFAAVDSVPFGGVKDSGYGRIHGPEGILEFTYPRTVVRARFQLPIAFTSFSRTSGNDKLIVGVTKFLKGRWS